MQSLLVIDGLSDHKITFSISSERTVSRKFTPKVVYVYDRANFVAINECLSRFYDDFSRDFSTRSVDDNWCRFRDKMHELDSLHLPKIAIKCFQRTPWFTKRLKLLLEKKKRLYRIAKRSNTALSWQKFSDCGSQYKKELKSAKRKFFNDDMPSLLASNPSKFWAAIVPRVNNTVILTDGFSEPIPEHNVPLHLHHFFRPSLHSLTTIQSLLYPPSSMI